MAYTNFTSRGKFLANLARSTNDSWNHVPLSSNPVQPLSPKPVREYKDGEVWLPHDFEHCRFIDFVDDNILAQLNKAFCPAQSSLLSLISKIDLDGNAQQINHSSGSTVDQKSFEEYLEMCEDDSDKDPDFELMDETDDESSNSDEPAPEKIKKRRVSENIITSAENVISTSEVPDNESIVKLNVKKKNPQPSEWKANKCKALRNSGLAYTSRTGKKYNNVAARNVKPPCEGCTHDCTSKFSEEERLSIFSKYWGLGDLEKQREYVIRHSVEITPQYTYKKTQRKLNHAFYLDKDEKKLRVCKHYFMATLDINRRTISTCFSKLKGGIIEKDRRGKQEKRKSIDETIKTEMRKHIDSIPRIESHYLRAQTTREYIEGGKTIAAIYRDYVKNCEETGKAYGTLSLFSRIFNTEYNISFFTPKKDQCDTCVSFNNLDEAGKLEKSEEFSIHQNEKKLSREEKERDKSNEDPNVIVCSYDLQAALPTPKGEVSTFYYKSKLSTFNLTIYEYKTKHGICNVWHEGDGNKGATEISTCVFRYISDKMEKIYQVDQDLEFIFYSDNCCGQQKNRFIMIMYMYALIKFPKIKSISHKFFIKGHTQNEGDGVHSVIEKEIKRASKSGPIYIPAQYVQLMRTAKKTQPFYQVNEFSYQNFIDFKKLTSNLDIKNFNLNTEGEKFTFSDIKVFRICRENPFVFLYKTSYTAEDFKTVNTLQSGRPAKRNSAQMETLVSKKRAVMEAWNEAPAYKTPPEIKPNKFKDLMSLVNNNYIPSTYCDFYRSLKPKK